MAPAVPDSFAKRAPPSSPGNRWSPLARVQMTGTPRPVTLSTTLPIAMPSSLMEFMPPSPEDAGYGRYKESLRAQIAGSKWRWTVSKTMPATQPLSLTPAARRVGYEARAGGSKISCFVGVNTNPVEFGVCPAMYPASEMEPTIPRIGEPPPPTYSPSGLPNGVHTVG